MRLVCRITSVILFLYSVAACSQQPHLSTASSDPVIIEMLKLRAPAPPMGVPGQNSTETNGDQPASFSEPAEDAPLDALGRYWSQLGGPKEKVPSAKVRLRLLEFCEVHPEFLSDLLDSIPTEPGANARAKTLFDKNAKRLGEDWSKKVREHLEEHGYFREEMLVAARTVKDGDEGGDVDNGEALERLAKVDWSDAEPVLKNLAAGNMQRTAVLASGLLYKHAVETDDQQTAAVLRAHLKFVVEDTKAKGYCRDKAAEALLSTNWAGRDEWYLSLFHDPTLRTLFDGIYAFHPLTELEGQDPDHWIPILTKLVDDPSRAVHDSAVSCLITFQLREGRRDALMPLLPWLLDPKWSSADDRLRLIQTVDTLDMKEAIPGLIAVLGQDDAYDRSYAAESLAHFKDPRAVPALWLALSKEKEDDHRRRIIEGLIACSGVTAAQAADAVQDFALFTATAEGRQRWEESTYSWGKIETSANVALGAYIANRGTEDEAAVELLTKRVEALKKVQPALAARLQSIISTWSSRAADLTILRHVQDGTATAHDLWAAIDRRASMQKTVASEVKEMEKQHGLPGAIAAVLLNDRLAELAILSSDDLEATEALLASARLAREPLPLDLVSKLDAAGHPLLQQSVEAFYESDDSSVARKLLLDHHKGEALILGAREVFDPGHHSYDDFNQLEAQLQDEIKTTETGSEVYALLSAGYWGSAGQIILRVHQGGAEIMYANDPARTLKRTLTMEELHSFQQWMTANQSEDLGPLNQRVYDGMQYEYIHLTRDGGRRVFMNNPGIAGSGGSVYDRLCTLFRDLLYASPLTLRYHAEEKVHGFEVLIADSRLLVGQVWKQGNDLRLAVVPNPYPEDVRAANPGALPILDKELAPSKKLSWVSIQAGHLRPAAAPEIFRPDDPLGVVPEKLEADHEENGDHKPLWQLTVGDKTYRLGSWSDRKSGLWQFERKHDPKLVFEGQYFSPVLSADGRWAVLSACKDSWAEPNFVIRVNIETGASDRLPIVEADRVEPLAWIEGRGALIKRYREERVARDPVGPDTPEYWLADPATDKAEIVQGEFAPFEEYAARPLETSKIKGHAWVAIWRAKEVKTEIGLYDKERFIFRPVMDVPDLRFESSQMWIDEDGHQAYIVYGGQLLRVAMPDSFKLEEDSQ